MGSIDYSSQEGDNYHKERHVEIFGNNDLIEAWGSYAEIAYMPKCKSGENILEIGAGTGINVSYISQRCNVYTVEPSQYAREHCENLGMKSFKDLESIPKDLHFRYILLRHVLEHVPEPTNFITLIKEFISHGTELIVVLPLENPKSPISTQDKDFHLYAWNRQTIYNLLTHCGLKVTQDRIAYHNGRRVLIPMYKLFGPNFYARLIQLVGAMTNCPEIILTCRSEK